MQMLQGGGAPPPGDAGGGGNPLGNPESALKVLNSMQQVPPQSGGDELFRQASAAVGQLYNQIAGRSAKAAKAVSEALVKLNQARQDLQQEGSRPLAGPPDLGMGGPMGGAPTQPPPMPGMGGM